jgi:quercetin dioxygenase-like cupin family protein
MNNYKIDFDKFNYETPIEGVKQKVFTEGKKQIRIVEYRKEMQLHWCEKGHYGLVLEGEMEIEFPEEKINYKPGDGVFIPYGVEHKHKAKALTESVKVIFVEDI